MRSSAGSNGRNGVPRNGSGTVRSNGGWLPSLRPLTSDLASRLQFAVRSGLGWGSRRVEQAQILGYDTVLTPQLYRAMYERDGVASRLVDHPAEETWGGGFRIVENPDVDTTRPFERDVESILTRLNVVGELERADKMLGVGPYSVVVIGAGLPNRPITLSSPLDANLRNDPRNVIYLTPLTQDNATVQKWETDATNPRYGIPLLYDCALGPPSAGGTWVDNAAAGYSRGQSGTDRVQVHHSRIIHIAEHCLDNRVYGRTRLRPVYDLVCALWKVVHGGAEAAWRRMDPGMHFGLDPELEYPPHPETGESAEEQIANQAEDYYLRNQRFTSTPRVTINR